MTVLFALAFSLTDWTTVWTASAHGPYPAGNAVAQPELAGILSPTAGASDQTFRLVLKPRRWAQQMRFRFSNALGKQPITIDGVYAGAHDSSGSIVAGTNVPVRFAKGASATIPPGQVLYSDAVAVKGKGGKLALSFHTSGVLTWHAKAIQTSYLSPPNSGSHGAEESNTAFPHTTTSWYLLDAVEAVLPCGIPVIMGFGDSITDGTGSTINGDDRWPDFLAQRLGGKAIVLNAGIGGNRVVTDAGGGGPSALARLDRDVLSLPGITTVIWMEGINDLSSGSATVEQITAGYREGVERMRKKGIQVIGATLTSALHSTPTAGTAEVDAKRRALNEFIRKSGVFDAVVDFDAATLDPATSELKKQYWPNSGTGGKGDGLHPNRAGYQAMANAVDLTKLRKQQKCGN